MIRRFIICLTFCLLRHTATAQEALPKRTLDQIKAATVLIEVGDQTQIASGSGFLIHSQDNTGYIATNVHVIEDELRGIQKLKCIFGSGTLQEQIVEAEAVFFNRQPDLAILKVTADSLPKSLSLSTESEVRETIIVRRKRMMARSKQRP